MGTNCWTKWRRRESLMIRRRGLPMAWKPLCPAGTPRRLREREWRWDGKQGFCVHYVGDNAAFEPLPNGNRKHLLCSFLSPALKKEKQKPQFVWLQRIQNIWGNLILFVLDIGPLFFSLDIWGIWEEAIPYFPSSLHSNEACQEPSFSLSPTEFPDRLLIPGRDLVRKQIYFYNSRKNPHQITQSLYLGHLCVRIISHVRGTFSMKGTRGNKKKTWP